MEPPERRAEAAAAPTAEEAVPDAGRDPETAPLVEPEPEPAAELGEVRVDVTEQQCEREQPDGDEDEQDDETIAITLKEFITGNAFRVSIDPDADVAALKRLIHEEHGKAEPDGQRLLRNDSPLEDETEELRDLGIAEGAELRLDAQDVVERKAARVAALRESLGTRSTHAKTLSDATFLRLVNAGCRTEADVWSLEAGALEAFLSAIAEEKREAGNIVAAIKEFAALLADDVPGLLAEMERGLDRSQLPQKAEWFEDEIYIDYEWNPGSEVLKRAGLNAAPDVCFSSLLTMTRNPESPLQLALNGALDDETGNMDPDGGRVPSNLKDSDGQLVVDKAVRFFRKGSPEGVDEEGKKTGRPADNSSAVRYNCFGATACFADTTYLPRLDSWKLACAYRPKDLENNFNGDKRVKGERIEHAIWKLQRVSKDPKDAEYSLVYIVKSGRGGDKHGVSLQDASVPPPARAGGQETDRLAASDRLLGLSEQEEEWVVWAPHMVTHRNDEFIFEVRGKHNLQAADDDWNAVYEGRTLTFGTGQRTRSYYDRCTNLTCKKKYGSAERTTAPGDDDYSQGVGERGEAGDLLLTNAKWRKASDESRVNAGDDGQNGEDDDDEEKGLRRNSTTPQLRGHQVWRLSIPAEVDQDAERPYYETVDDFANWLTDWKKFLLIKVFFIGLAVLGSFMGPALSEQDAMAGVWALVGEAIGLLVGAIVVSLVWCVMSWCGCKGQREDE